MVQVTQYPAHTDPAIMNTFSHSHTPEHPSNPWTSMLDRNKFTRRQAVGIFSTLVKSGMVQGKEMDLDKFTLSQSSETETSTEVYYWRWHV